MADRNFKYKANNQDVFELDDGTREIALVNRYGELICKIHFRTAELAIVDRFNDLEKDFPKIIEPLGNININPDGTVNESDEESWAVLKRVEADIKRRLNTLLDSSDADEIFKTRFPFSSINGRFFIENVLDVLGKAITVRIEEEAKLSQARLKKYTDDLDKNEVTADAGESA